MTADHRTTGYDAAYAVFDSPLSCQLRYVETVIELSRRKALARLMYLAAAV